MQNDHFTKEYILQTQNINHLTELQKLSCSLVKKIQIPQIILLEGDLASGKTQMVQYIGEALGFSKSHICSPTFSLINVYHHKNKSKMYHVDLYRLQSQIEIDNISFWDIFYSPSLVCIEWPHLVANKLPALWNQLVIKFQFEKDKNTRILTWDWLMSKN